MSLKLVGGRAFPKSVFDLVQERFFDRRPRTEMYVFNLQDLIPTFPLPLRAEDAEPIIDLHSCLDQVYDRAGYAFAIDYSREPLPPAAPTNTEWIDALLREKQLR